MLKGYMDLEDTEALYKMSEELVGLREKQTS